MNIKKILLILIVVLIIGVVVFAIIKGGTSEKEDNGKLDIVVTSFAGYDFMRQIAGDKVNITNLLSPRCRNAQL